jgi:hypothetical protein
MTVPQYLPPRAAQQFDECQQQGHFGPDIPAPAIQRSTQSLGAQRSAAEAAARLVTLRWALLIAFHYQTTDQPP